MLQSSPIIKMNSVFCLRTPLSTSLPDMEGISTTGGILFEDVPMVHFMYLVFTCIPRESYHRRLRSLLLCLCVTSFER